MKLKQLEVNDFAGINHSSPVIIDFTNKWVQLEGDKGVGKTSMLNALLVACGQLSHTGKEGKNFINQDTEKIDINFDFIGNDRCNYKVRCTKSSFQLTYEGENVSEPITKMKELLGVVGVSPMEIKNKPLKDIVKWLSTYSTKSAEEFEKQMYKFKDGIKTAETGRADSNRTLKALTEYLNEEDMFLNWELSENKYIKAPNIAELSKQLTEAGSKSDKYITNETKVKGQKSRQEQLSEQIKNLNKELEEVNKNITVGEKWLDENKTAKKDCDDVKKKYDTAAQDVADFNKWQEIKRKKTEKDEYETLSQQFDTKAKEIKQSMKELQAEILPDIKGVDMVMEDTHEDGVAVKEGLYWNGRNVAQMSETEWWDIVLMIWRKYKVKIIVIDNYSNLGSSAVEILEKLSKDGCYILAAEMNREQKTLQIDYK